MMLDDVGEMRDKDEKVGCIRRNLSNIHKSLLEQEERLTKLDQALRLISRTEDEEKVNPSKGSDRDSEPEVCEELHSILRRITTHTSFLNNMLDRLEI